ncbi:MAG TPA: hypothetical protein VF173_26345 [Thermoanaerobaculia bacterium]|nr:hypothetical protein [Thermoanaerobaculia bacterium]
MRKILMAVALAIPMALMAASAFAAPAEQPQVPTPAQANQTRLVSQNLADEIFLPAPDVAPPAVPAAFWGVCNLTCLRCFSASGCPVDPDTGRHQSCVFACP